MGSILLTAYGDHVAKTARDVVLKTIPKGDTVSLANHSTW
jgi:hypothetical protein